MMRGVFVSDLHLFARRSLAAQYRQELRFAAAQSQVFVLGGDIFDFKWSQLKSFEFTVKAALDWIRELMHPFPTCKFHYLLGNHDDHPYFVEMMMRLSQESSQLMLHPHCLRLGTHVFLHGHVLDGYMLDQASFHDLTKMEAISAGSHRGHSPLRSPPPLAHAAYEVLVRARLHRLIVAMVHRRKSTAERLANYLESQGLGANAGVTDVLFGHTHRTMTAFVHKGLRFHNGGAAIVGLPFKIIPWEADVSDAVGPHALRNEGIPYAG